MDTFKYLGLYIFVLHYPVNVSKLALHIGWALSALQSSLASMVSSESLTTPHSYLSMMKLRMMREMIGSSLPHKSVQEPRLDP